MEQLQNVLDLFVADRSGYIRIYIGIVRYLLPLLGLLLLVRCALPLVTFRREPEIWAWLKLPGSKQVPVTHWETVIGRSKSSDITVGLSTVSRNHAVLTRYDDGSWTVADAGSRSGTLVNGQRKEICALQQGDVITIGGVDIRLQPITAKQEQMQSKLRTKASSGLDSLANLMVLTVIQALVLLGYLLTAEEGSILSLLTGFAGIAGIEWILFFFYVFIRRSAFEIETLAFFLCTMGMAAIAAVKPEEAGKQLVAVGLGVLLFLLVGWSLRDLERAKRFRYLAVVAGVGFLAVTLVFGKEYYGAKNWVEIGGMSLQPSELSKLCFVFAGASTMDRIMNKRNLVLFIAYSVFICALLALMNDFGTALIFFGAFLMIAYLRSGSMGTLALAITALGIAGMMAFRIAPHALRRFAAWRHAWENPYSTGYQQVYSMMCIASGGLFGLGPGQGWMRHIFAADSDVVFATVSEEWGLLLTLQLILVIMVLGLFAVRTSRVARSSFYSIGACTAAGILLIQTMLNCLGTVDLLPFTGVTFPFVSNGGTSMIGAWGLLAFIKASDTRQNASFAVKLTKRGRMSK